MFSSFTAIGLFSLTRCTSTEGNIVFQAMGSQITTTLNGSSYIYYNTEITCMDGQSMTAKIRVSTDLPVAEQPNNAIAFVTGTAYIDAVSQQGYINASCFKFVDKKPTLSSLPPGPTFFSTFFDCLGTVCGDSYVLDDEDASVAFPVLMRVCILDDIKTTRLMYVFFYRLSPLTNVRSQVHLFRAKSPLGHHSGPFPGHQSPF